MASKKKFTIQDRIAMLPNGENNTRKPKGDSPSGDRDTPVKPGRRPMPPLPDENKDESMKSTRPPIPPLPDENTETPKLPSTDKRKLPLPPSLSETDEQVKSTRPAIPPISEDTAAQIQPPLPPLSSLPQNKDRRGEPPKRRSNLPLPPSLQSSELPSIPSRITASKEKKGEADKPVRPPIPPISDGNTEEIPPPIPQRPKSSGTSDAKRTIKVSGFDRSVSEEALRLHFENRVRSGGGSVEMVRISDGTALVRFKLEEVAERVLGKEQKLGHQQLKVEFIAEPATNARHSDTMKATSFVVSGMAPSTTHEILQDFLESETKYTVEGLFELSEGHVSVTFSQASNPDLTELQMVLQSSSVGGRHLHIEIMSDEDEQTDYLEPLMLKDVSITGEKFKYLEFFKKDTLLNRLNKVHVTATFDPDKFEIKLKGKKGDLDQGERCLKNISENLVAIEKNIEKPGIVAFLESEEAKKRISEIEMEERCAIFVSGSIYETFEMRQEEEDVLTDSDSNPSGGSFQSAGVSETGSKTSTTESTPEVVPPAEGDYVLLQSTEHMAKFQIGLCQFQIKKGTVEKEDVPCAVNVTHTDLEQGDLWSVLKESDQKELQRQLNMKTLLSEWGKKGIVMSTTSGLQYPFIIHVSLKHCGGDLRKAIRKTLQMAQNSPEITSIAFYKRVDQDDGACPRFLRSYVDEINRYQKTGHPGVKDIRLVMDTMNDSYVTGVRQELENLLASSKKLGFKQNLLNMIPKRLRSYSSPLPHETGSDKFKAYIEPPKDVKEPQKQPQSPSKPEAVQIPIEDQPLEGTETMVLLCSESADCNDRTLKRFKEYYETNMPPKIVENQKIKLLSESQITLFRRKAGRKVELEIDKDNGRVQINGFAKHVNSVYATLKVELERIPDPVEREQDDTPKKDVSKSNEPEIKVTLKQVPHDTHERKEVPLQSKPETTYRQDDEYDIFGKHVAFELRGIKDDAKRLKVKRDIQRVLFDAQE